MGKFRCFSCFRLRWLDQRNVWCFKAYTSTYWDNIVDLKGYYFALLVLDCLAYRHCGSGQPIVFCVCSMFSFLFLSFFFCFPFVSTFYFKIKHTMPVLRQQKGELWKCCGRCRLWNSAKITKIKNKQIQVKIIKSVGVYFSEPAAKNTILLFSFRFAVPPAAAFRWSAAARVYRASSGVESSMWQNIMTPYSRTERRDRPNRCPCNSHNLKG